MELINANDTPSVEEKDKPQNGKNSYKLRYPQGIYLQHVQTTRQYNIKKQTIQ